MKKIKASQAKINADATLINKDNKVLTDIYKQIDAASRKGKYTLSYYGAVSLLVENRLRDEGYLVSKGGGRHSELGIDISWTAPTN